MSAEWLTFADTHALVDTLTPQQIQVMHDRYPEARAEILEFVDRARDLIDAHGLIVGAAVVGVEHMHNMSAENIDPEVMAGMLGIALVELAQLLADRH
jgi:hypothetical protein